MRVYAHYACTYGTVPFNRAREPQCKPAGLIAVFGGTTDCVQQRIVRRRLQPASSRLCRRHDTNKRNRRWPLAQSHQGTAPAVSSSPKRSPRQAREQKADGAWRWEGRLVVERRLVILTRVGRCCWLAPHRLPYAHQTVDPKRGEQGSSIASLARRLGQRQPAKGRENSRGCHARPLGDRHRHAKLTVRRNFPPSPSWSDDPYA
jgi:transposase-like protein